MTNKSISWFRHDLRLYDNQSLVEATKSDDCFPIFILDSDSEKPIGEASLVWLHHGLKSLQKDLNNTLALFHGNPKDILISLVKKHGINSVYFDHSYDPEINRKDIEIIKELEQLNCKVIKSFQQTLWPINDILKQDQTPYKVFTPFYKKGCLNEEEPSTPVSSPDLTRLRLFDETKTLESVLPLPTLPWAETIIKHWDISEAGAQKKWKSFLKEGLNQYKQGRNFPAKPYVSQLSPYIHFGQISLRQLYHEAIASGSGSDLDHFISELGWREFAYYLLYHFPKITTANFQEKFDLFPWKYNETYYKAWCHGQTGYPIVDAGMRELYQTGYMHNRVRMICGSFLVKNLLIHWSYGEKWFWDCLFDADSASNVTSWQWVAGSGADAAPYFRIFNPILQGSKFDPKGEYIYKYVPELKKLPLQYLNEPWSAPDYVLNAANIKLGETYPKPIIDYKTSRDLALLAYQDIKK